MRVRYIAFLTALMALALTAVPSLAQDRGTVQGKVTDKRTRHAIPFATVTVVGAQRGALTDAEGHYFIPNVPAGSYEVRVQFLGYSPGSQADVAIRGGQATEVDFQLEEVVVRREKEIEVTAERRLVEVRQGATVRSVNANEIRNLPVQTISDVLQQQAGITVDADQIHVRGGRTDETVFMINGVANKDLVTGQSTAGQLNARSVAEVNVATGAYDVRYGNALSGVVEIKLKEGTDRATGGVTLTSGRYGARAFQAVVGGPDPVLQPMFRALRLPGTVSSIVDISGTLYDTRFENLLPQSPVFFADPSDGPYDYLRSSYKDSFFGDGFDYGKFWSPTTDNRWSGRYGLTWRPNSRDKLNLNFQKRIAVDQGFSRTFITTSGDEGEPAYPWRWARRIAHAPTFFEDNVQSSLEWRRTLSTTGFLEFQLSRYFFAQRRDVLGKHWSQYVEPDDRSIPDSTMRSDFFIDTGDDNTWQDRRNLSHSITGSLLQRLGRHEMEIGFEHEFQSVQYVTIEDPWVFDPDGLGGAHDLWKVHPWTGNIYLRDKLEYEGFTANIGIRADYWFIGREAERAMADTANTNISPTTRDNFYEDTHSFFGRRFKAHISPRVIVAHPITENSSFFFNYGQFTQIPSYRYVYSKLTSISSESFPLLGNPNLNPQVSINYELGAKHQFLPTAAINASFFVKDVYDYPSATTFKRTQGASLVDIFVYLNGHFARAKGFELELEKRRSNHWSGKIVYTFQQTKGKSSDANEQKVVQENGGDAAETRLSETFVRWNRPHKLTANFDLRFDQETPDALWFLKQSGVNIYVSGSSGRAYTPINVATDQAGQPYSKNATFQSTVDVKLNRYFRLGNGNRLDFSLTATNIFGNRLIQRVDRVTGAGRVWGVGEYNVADFPEVNDYVKVSEVDDPSNYGPGAQWRFAVDYDF